MALKNSLHLLIMAGGSGTRFWPKSTAVKPKQLLALWDDKTLIEHTLERFEGTVEDKNAFVITTEKILGPTKEILKRHPEVRYLAEPTGKNTAPCILWGVLEVYKKNPDAVIAVLPADHFIGDVSKFLNTVLSAAEFASKNPGIVTLGIQPNKPETGYGYIEAASSGNSGAFQKVSRFVEKPDLRTANRYLEAGNYLWNAGMFIFKASEGYNAFKRCMPSLFSLFEKSTNVAESYLKISKEDSITVDYGVMERASQHDIPVWVLPTNCQWNDVGSFIALE